MQKPWWVAMGYPEWEAGSDRGPRPGQVITYFRLRKIMPNGKPCTQKDVARTLSISVQSVIKMEKHDVGLDSITRRQSFITLFAIPPLLLGLAPLSEHQAPIGLTVAQYRHLKLKQNGKPWTQKDLAEALDISEQSAIKMEKRDVGLDSIARRQFLSKLFQIPPALLGIAAFPEMDLLADVPSQQSYTDTPAIDIATLRENLHIHWKAHHTGNALDALVEITTTINLLYEALTFSKGKSELREVLCRYFILLGKIYSDQQRFDDAIEQFSKAIKLAKQIKLGKQPEHYELHAVALYRRGWAYFDKGDVKEALRNHQAAERLLKHLPDYIKGAILIASGDMQVRSAMDNAERRKGLSKMDTAATVIFAHKEIVEDGYHLKVDIPFYQVYKAAALVGTGWNKDAITEFAQVQRSPDLKRRGAFADIHEAQAYANLGKYEQACAATESALVVVKDIKSAINYARVVTLHDQLEASSFGNNPEVARLTYLLYGKQ